jgi:sulfate/thiosulfate transport system ATP-binding protein
MSIEAIRVTKTYGKHYALREVSVEVKDGELVALLGPSGSGKTSLLRVIAGLEAPDAGKVLFAGKEVTRASVTERGVGFVFQHYALFREMTVFENVAFGLRVKPRRERPNEKYIRARVGELLELVHLGSMADRYPSQLSGGQRQRVALARALAVEPRFLLLDEPFGALDAKVRKQLRAWLRELHDELGVTTVLVTHDRDEALELADRIVLMNEGEVEQQGSPTDLYDAPRTAFVESFLCDVNLLEGTVDADRTVAFGRLRVDAKEAAPGETVRVVLRIGEVALSNEGEANATIARMIDLGERAQIEATVDDGPIIRARAPRDALRTFPQGSRVRVGAHSLRVYRE